MFTSAFPRIFSQFPPMFLYYVLVLMPRERSISITQLKRVLRSRIIQYIKQIISSIPNEFLREIDTQLLSFNTDDKV